MGAKMKAIEKMAGDLSKDIYDLEAVIKRKRISIEKLEEVVDSGFDVLYHQAIDMGKRVKMTDPKKKLKELDFDKTLDKSVKAIKDAGGKLKQQCTDYHNSMPKFLADIGKRCVSLRGLIQDVLNHKLCKGTKSKNIDELAKIYQIILDIENKVEKIDDDGFGLIDPKSSIHKNVAKLSTDMTVKDLGDIAKHASDDIAAGRKMFDKMYSRLNQVRAKRADQIDKLVKKVAADLEKELGKANAP